MQPVERQRRRKAAKRARRTSRQIHLATKVAKAYPELIRDNIRLSIALEVAVKRLELIEAKETAQ